MQKQLEREIKFHMEPDAEAPDLAPLPHDLSVVERPEVRLSARYFDTAHLDLLRRGITLRHRQDMNGDGENLWTLKLPDGAQSSVWSRTEISWPGDGPDVPHEARHLLTAVLHQQDLLAVAAFVTVRRRREVLDRAGRRLAEVDDDRVTVTSPTAKVFRQIEVELDGGDADLAAALSKILRRSGASRSDNAPKLRIVLADRIEATPSGTRAHPTGTLTLGELFRHRVEESFDKLVTHDIGLRLGDQTENVHQARVACRRLRSDVKTFRSILDLGWAERISGELRWLGTVLGAVRDLDVLQHRIAGHAVGPDANDADGFAAIAVRIAALRSAAAKELRAVMAGDRYQQLLRDLDRAAVDPPLTAAGTGPAPTDRAADSIGRLVRAPWRRLRSTVRKLPEHPTDAQLHRVRIRAKQLRYASESATPIVGSAAKHLAKAAERLQTELGDHHDAVVAEAALRRIAPSLKRHAAFVAGQCVAAEQQVQQAERESWPTAWRAIDRRRLRRWITQ